MAHIVICVFAENMDKNVNTIAQINALITYVKRTRAIAKVVLKIIMERSVILALLVTMVLTVMTIALYNVITKRVTDILVCVFMAAKKTTQVIGVAWNTKTASVALPILHVLNVRQVFINRHARKHVPTIV